MITQKSVLKDSECWETMLLFRENQGKPDVQVWAPHQECCIAFRTHPHLGGDGQGAARRPSLRINVERI